MIDFIANTAPSTELSKKTAGHCAALFYCDSDEATHGIEGQGTMTFVQYRNKYFGITNEHVVPEGSSSERLASLRLALSHHTPVPGKLFFQTSETNPDFPFDLCIFELNPWSVKKSGKCFIDLHDGNVVPEAEGRTIFAVGFPGHERHGDERKTIHPIYHVVSTPRHNSDRKIILRDELPHAARDIRFGGMSGGPIFSVDEASGTYILIGIIFQGSAWGDVDYGKGLKSDICIWGFPFSGATLGRILDRRLVTKAGA